MGVRELIAAQGAKRRYAMALVMAAWLDRRGEALLAQGRSFRVCG